MAGVEVLPAHCTRDGTNVSITVALPLNLVLFRLGWCMDACLEALAVVLEPFPGFIVDVAPEGSIDPAMCTNSIHSAHFFYFRVRELLWNFHGRRRAAGLAARAPGFDLARAGSTAA